MSFAQSLKREICGGATDKFLELLLTGMDLAFAFSESYRKNIADFNATYVFCTADGQVGSTAAFSGGQMHVHTKAADRWDTKVTFRDPDALRKFLFAKDQDILNSLLTNDVEVDGNLSLIYKYGYMARDLARRLGV